MSSDTMLFAAMLVALFAGGEILKVVITNLLEPPHQGGVVRPVDPAALEGAAIRITTRDG